MLPIMIAAIESTDDRDLMTAFYLNYKGRLYAEAWKFMDNEDDASDMVYSALVRIIDRMDVFKSLSPYQRGAYAITAVRHECMRQMQKHKVRKHLTISEETNENKNLQTEPMEELVARRIMSEKFQPVWDALSQRDQLILEQKYLLHYTDEEMASELGVAQSSVRMLLTRARRRLLQRLQAHHLDPREWL